MARLAISLSGIPLVYFFPNNTDDISFIYYLLILAIFLSYSLCSNFMFVSQGAFFAKIADARIGGTYMTLLNTISNFGGTYPKFFVFYLIDLLTQRGCVDGNMNVQSYSCQTINTANEQPDGKCNPYETCVILYDGYFVVALGCAIIGILCYYIYSPILNYLQSLGEESWHIRNKNVSDDISTDD